MLPDRVTASPVVLVVDIMTVVVEEVDMVVEEEEDTVVEEEVSHMTVHIICVRLYNQRSHPSSCSTLHHYSSTSLGYDQGGGGGGRW